MRFRGTLILLVVLAALGAYVLLVERRAPIGEAETVTPMPTLQPPLLTLASADARAVRIESLGDERRTEFAYRDSGLWHIIYPVEEEADQGQVVRLVEELADLRPRRALTRTTAPLADYGLEPPAMRVEVELADGSWHAILLGARGCYSYWVNTLPHWHIEFYLACQQGDWEEATRRHRKLLEWERNHIGPLMAEGHRHAILGKARGALTGFLEDAGWTRAPYYPISEERLGNLAKAFTEFWGSEQVQSE